MGNPSLEEMQSIGEFQIRKKPEILKLTSKGKYNSLIIALKHLPNDECVVLGKEEFAKRFDNTVSNVGTYVNNVCKKKLGFNVKISVQNGDIYIYTQNKK